jgi:hypothetical protein
VIGKRSVSRPLTTAGDLISAYGSTVLLALCNPLTMLPYVASASSLARGTPLNSPDTLFAVFGVILGAMSWYLTLIGVTVLLGREISGRTASCLNLVAGAMLIGLGGGIAIGWF